MWARLKLAVLRLLSWLGRHYAGPHVQALVVQTPWGRLAVAPHDQGVGRQLRLCGDYGGDELRRLRPYTGPEVRALVVGAHVGALALPLSSSCREVVAIEANPQTFALLETNIRLNAVANCRAIAVAASDTHGDLEFLLSRANSGGSKRRPLHADWRYVHDRPQIVRVPCERLDDLLAGQRFEIVTMDIEGSEVFALRGMTTLLQHCRCLVVEFVPHHLRRVAGVDVETFLAAVPPHLDTLHVPSQGLAVPRAEAARVLGAMMAADRSDDGVMFTA